MTKRSRRLLGAAAVSAALMGVTGCLDYTIETTLREDGTGARVERMEVTRNSDFDLPAADFRVLTRSRGRGWTPGTRVDSDGDTTWVLERRNDIGRLGEWADPSRGTLILGALPSKADERVGYVRLGDVAFRSSIQVGVTRRSDGTSMVSYRESFLWDQAADALVEFILQSLDRSLRARYSRLTEGERGSVLGFARARIWVAGEEGLFFGENEDEAIARAAEQTAAQAVKIVRVRYPEATADELREMIATIMSLEDGAVERLFVELLPGLNLAFNTKMVFRLTLPGTVGTTNAQHRSGNTLEWEFSPMDNLTKPLEVFAEAVVGG
ncbi:MAG: hypothetical protein AMXMBFR53_01180 [Gemmatimonadota bacterium]